MAGRRKQTRVLERDYRRYPAGYEDGNAARKLEAIPQDRKKKLSSTAKRNRAKSTNVSRGYIAFLALMCALATGACVWFLRLTAEVTAQKSAVAQKELELNELQADNDAYYSEVTASTDLEEIRNRAINELGMQFAAEDQIKYYTPGNNSYVRQYQDVPEE